MERHVGEDVLLVENDTRDEASSLEVETGADTGQRAAEEETGGRIWRIARKVGAVAALGTIGFYAGSLSMNNLGLSTEHVGPVTVQVGAQFEFHSWHGIPYPSLGGGTDVEGHLLGNVMFPTHGFGPEITIDPLDVDLSGTVDTIKADGNAASRQQGRTEGLSIPMAQDGMATFTNSIEADINNVIGDAGLIAARSAGFFILGELAGIGAAAAGYGLLRALNDKNLTRSDLRRWVMPRKEAWIAATLATTLALGSAATIAASFDQAKFMDPQLSGIVADLWPYVASVTELDSMDKTKTYRDVANIVAFKDIVQQAYLRDQNLPETTRVVILVSDIHDRKVFDVIQKVAANQQVSLIIDTGDITDHGTRFEPQLRGFVDDIKKLKVPYVVVGGNHDSNDTLQALTAAPNVRVIPKGQVDYLTIDGIGIVAASDPVLTPGNNPTTGQVTAAEEGLAKRLTQRQQELAQAGQPVDMAASHEEAAVTELAAQGQVPLLIHGHDHRAHVTINEQTLVTVADPGSTGGGGIRTAQPGMTATGPDPVPADQSFVILSLDKYCAPVKSEIVKYNILAPDPSASITTVFSPPRSHASGEIPRCPAATQ